MSPERNQAEGKAAIAGTPKAFQHLTSVITWDAQFLQTTMQGDAFSF